MKRTKDPWLLEEDKIVIEYYNIRTKEDLLLKIPSHTWCSIQTRASKLKVANYRKIDIFKRLETKYVIKENDCWEWQGSRSRRYGYIKINGKDVAAHIFLYENKYGKVPDELELDHLCRNTYCINPDHLEAVTHRINILRGNSPSAICARKTHCIRNHELNKQNTYIDKRGGRHCKFCYKVRREIKNATS